LITEVLIGLAGHPGGVSGPAAQSLKRLREIHAGIKQIKREEAGGLVAELEAQLLQLHRRSPAQFKRLGARLQAALADGA
jgi:hypothetical protein